MSDTTSATATSSEAQNIGRSADLAVLPHVVFRVLELTSAEDSQPPDLEKAIAVDPGFSSKLLVLANSAAFGLPRRVTSIREAILYLGFRTIRSAALTVGMFDLFVGKTDQESLRRREWWRQSVDTAICAKWIATQGPDVPVEDAYTTGLLHLIGKTLLDRFGGRNYSIVQQMVDLGVSDRLSEEKVYGCDHTEVAASAALSWGLPVALQSGLRYLTPPSPGDESAKLRSVTAVASIIAARARTGQKADKDCPVWALQHLNLTEEKFNEFANKARTLIADADLRI